MKELYLLIGSYDEGADIVYPFYAYDQLEVMEYVLSHKDEYEPVFRSIRHGNPCNTPEDLWHCIDRTYVDGDSTRGWTLFVFPLDGNSIKHLGGALK